MLRVGVMGVGDMSGDVLLKGQGAVVFRRALEMAMLVSELLSKRRFVLWWQWTIGLPGLTSWL